MKPTLFIGTSVESLRLGYAIQQELEHDAEVTIWSQGIFQLSNSTLEDLCKSLELFDFALFVFSPSDTTIIRKEEFNSVRDNVLFEFGLFVGRLGRERTFFVIPRGDADLRIPTDLLGIKAGTYWPDRQDRNLID
jgi:predicted nucleotide-binding protein